MKLVLAIVQDKDAQRLVENLVSKGYGATKMATTGGFLKVGNTTLLIGAMEDSVEDVLQMIRETCSSREELLTPMSTVGGPVDTYVTYPVEVTVGGATVFVLGVDRFEKL